MKTSALRLRLVLFGVLLATLASALLLSTSPPEQAVSRGAGDSFAQASASLPGTMVLAQAALPPARQVMTPTCMNCHGSAPKHPIQGARLTYDHSAHKNGGNSTYANGGGCQQCHTNEGFIEWTQKGSVTGFVSNPSQPGCTTCHAPHETDDMRLRTVKPVALVNKTEFDGSQGNLCASCHRARSDAAATVKDLPASGVTTRLSPHYGPQADMMVGTNAYQFPGKTYDTSDHYSSVDNTCVSCHMSLPQARYSLSPEVGGHSMNVAGDVHGTDTLNISACSSCHKDIKQATSTSSWSKSSDTGVQWVGPTPVFAMTSEDYDRDGKIEYVQDEVQGLMDRLVNQQGTGALQTKVAIYDAKGTFIGSRATTPYTATQVGALYNYRFVLEDRSRGIHNVIYTVQLLTDSIAALDPTFDVSGRPD